MAAIGITESSSFTSDSTKAKSAATSIFTIVDRKSKIDPSDESGTTLENVKGEIELCHISFKYPSRPDVQIFRDLSLTVHSGKVNDRLLNVSQSSLVRDLCTHTSHLLLFSDRHSGGGKW